MVYLRKNLQPSNYHTLISLFSKLSMSIVWARRVVLNEETVLDVGVNAGNWYHCSIRSARALKKSVCLFPWITAFPSIFGEHFFLEFEIVH